MKVLITSGGTREKIDDVRAITNFSTGTLGSIIADEFKNQNKNCDIIYLCSETAKLPKNEDIEIIKISGVDDLLSNIKSILENRDIDAVIHSMAVSDYKLSNVSTTNEIADEIIVKSKTQDIKTAITETLNKKSERQSGKLSSKNDNLVLTLTKTPKIIEEIKKISPNTLLVGFKLLSNVSKDTLIETGKNILKKNDCNYVLANDLNDIDKDKHIGYFISSDGSYTILNTKKEIAIEIASQILNDMER